MFYLAPAMNKTTKRWLFGMLVTGLILPLAVLFATIDTTGWLSPGKIVAISSLPAALVIWAFHPFLVLKSLAGRKRKRSDASLLFWKSGMGTALLIIPLATTALLLPDPRWQVLFGWVAIWGWAGMIMHGMLSRIVPFLVWFHRFSARVGLEPVPSMRGLLSQQRIKIAFILHAGSVVLGTIAILFQVALLAQLTGLVLIATAISLGNMLVHVLRHR